MNRVINIDHVPYNVTREGNYTVLHDVEGSVLSNLDTDPAVTGFRGSDERGYTIHPKTLKPIQAEYDPEAGTFAIACGFDAAVQWIDDHFHGIDEIGWEVLNTFQGAERLSDKLRG